jgi:hypothetical protein
MRAPRRTADPAEAVAISARDGVCVLTALANDTDSDAADRMPHTLWGDGLTGWLGPAEIRNTGAQKNYRSTTVFVSPTFVNTIYYRDTYAFLL